MTDTVVHVPWWTAEVAADLARQVFLRNYHHLISPWFFSKPDRLERDRAILIDGWAKARG